MPFRVKNISKNYNIILGIDVEPETSIDLLETSTVEEITSSILFGELYKKLWGRMFCILSPGTDLEELNLTQEQFSNLTMSGVLQGFLGLEDLKAPFNFTKDGKLLTDTPPIEINNVEISTKKDGYNLIEVGTFINNSITTTSYYIDMLGWRFMGLWVVLGNNTVGKIYCSGEFNKISNLASYIDVTNYLFCVNSLPQNETHMLNIDTPFPFRWIKIEIETTDVINSCNILAHQIKSI